MSILSDLELVYLKPYWDYENWPHGFSGFLNVAVFQLYLKFAYMKPINNTTIPYPAQVLSRAFAFSDRGSKSVVVQ
jgi:hypothetical protein